MDDGSSQPDATQATQTVFDPRREGKQNSGFSDEEMPDVICILAPTTMAAQREVEFMAKRGVPYVVSRDQLVAKRVGNTRHDASRDVDSYEPQEYLIVLQLSHQVKVPKLGFVFGRNANTCDMCFHHDPRRRVSNNHFRIYVNKWGHVMVESNSTNGTIVDDQLLNRASRNNKRMLISGTRLRVLMHGPDDHIEFAVRIPQRDGHHVDAYMANVGAHIRRRDGIDESEGEGEGAETTVTPDANGKIDAFRPSAHASSIRPPDAAVTKEWSGHPDYYKVGLIGRGAFASVYRVTRRLDGEPYAAKELDTQRFIKNGATDVRVDNEMRIMRSIQHPNIVRYMEHFFWEKLMIIIMEMVPCGDVGKYIGNNGPMPEPLGQTLATQMLGALGHLHDLGVAHRDIKPDNILIQSMDPPVFKLTDFGLSKMVADDKTFLRTFCGTLLYCAPEVYAEYSEYDANGHRCLKRSHHVSIPRYGYRVDVWSLGAVLYYCLANRPPFPAKTTSHTELLHRIMTTDLNVEPLRNQLVSHMGINFIRLMLQRRPDNRADVETLQGHMWLNPCLHATLPDETSSGDENEDKGLRIGASQLSLQDGGEPASGLVVDDDYHHQRGDDEMDSETEAGAAAYSLGGVSQDSNFESTPQRGPPTVIAQKQEQKQQQQQRDLGPMFFGEVDISAVNSSSGLVAEEHRLNLNVSESFATVIVEDDDSDLDDYTIVRGPVDDDRPRLASVSRGQSPDQLQSLVADVFSQDINAPPEAAAAAANGTGSSSSGESNGHSNGRLSDNGNSSGDDYDGNGDEFAGEEFDGDFDDDLAPTEGPTNMAPPPLPHARRARADESRVLLTADYNTSKRKDPPPYEASDDEPDDPRQAQSMTKRIKAGDTAELTPQAVLDEYRLMASIPPRRLDTRRLIDDPVNKTNFWVDRKSETWHCNYPEMTLLQYEAFVTAAAAHGHEFAPYKSSPFWDLAMRHFAPTRPGMPPPPTRANSPGVSVSVSKDDDLARLHGGPGTGLPRTPVVVAVPPPEPSQPLAWLESTEESAVGGISLTVCDAMMSWGRGPDNTEVHGNKAEMRVPRYGFRILLWREGYDASRDPPRSLIPWNNPLADPDSFHFYISTKATNGIHVNDFRLPSHDPHNVSTPAHYWIPLHHGDVIGVWEVGANHTSMEFRCRWGGSRHARPAGCPPRLVSAKVSRKLDAIYYKKDDRLRRCREIKQLQDDAEADLKERRANIEQERERSVVFEQRCREAAAYLGLKSPGMGGKKFAIGGGGGSMSRSSSTPALVGRGVGVEVGRGVFGMGMPRPAVTQ